jgi:hypothetical protein
VTTATTRITVEQEIAQGSAADRSNSGDDDYAEQVHAFPARCKRAARCENSNAHEVEDI